MAKEKKGAKFGRHSERSPSAKAYRAEHRHDRNKRLRMAKAERIRKRDFERVRSMKVPRGTARAARVQARIEARILRLADKVARQKVWNTILQAFISHRTPSSEAVLQHLRTSH